MPGIGIHRNPGLLSNSHVSELRLLVVSNDPHLGERRERGDLAPDAHQLAGLDPALSDDTVLRCGDRRVFKVEPRHDECSASGGDGGLALCDLCVEDRQFTLRGLRLGSILREFRLEPRASGFQAFPWLQWKRIRSEAGAAVG